MTQITRIFSIACLSFFLFIACSNTQATEITINNNPVQVFFSPNEGCTDAIVKKIGKAKQEILVQAYSFTSKEIAKALVDAKKRGVHVEIILDKSNRSQQYSAADFTDNIGIPTYIASALVKLNDPMMTVSLSKTMTLWAMACCAS